MSAKRVMKILGAAAVYFALGWIGRKTDLLGTGPSPIWPPSGYALSLLILGGFEYLPSIVLGAGGLLLLQLHDPIAITGFTLADVTEPLVGAWLLAGQRRFDPSFRRLSDAILFVLAAVACTTAGALMGTLALRLSGTVSWSEMGTAWFHWWVPNVVSVLTLTPVFLTFSSQKLKIPERGPAGLTELGLELLGLALLDAFVFFPHHPHPYLPLMVMYADFLLHVTISIRWNVRVGATALFLTSVIGIIGTMSGRGPYTIGSPSDNLVVLQFTVLIAAILLIVLSSLFFEQKDTLEETRKAIRTRDDFLSIASHELNTPLTSMKLQSQFLQDLAKRGSLKDYPQEQLNSLLRINEKQVSRLSELVQDLLDVSRIGAQKFAIQCEPGVSLSEIVRSVADRYRMEANRSQIELELDDGISGNWDASRVDQVVVNLLSNALKYGQGKPIYISSRVSGALACLKVRDQGMGIAREDHGRIFDRFERAASMRTYPGMGLGLYIAREIVLAHGGSIQIQSELGAGSTFTILLPLDV